MYMYISSLPVDPCIYNTRPLTLMKSISSGERRKETEKINTMEFNKAILFKK